jgi:hypothetical protein
MASLIILKRVNAIEFFFSGENHIWIIWDYPDKKGWFLAEEREKKGLAIKVVREFYGKYEEIGVNGLWGLYEALIRNPEKTLELFLGKKEVKEVIAFEEEELEDNDNYTQEELEE